MKIKRYRIYGCLLLICAIGISVDICSSYANNQKPLSFNEMSSVYGGVLVCPGWYFAPNGKGCAAAKTACILTGCMEIKTSCKQAQDKCASVEYGYQNCDDIDFPCYGTYSWVPCALVAVYPSWHCEPLYELMEERDCEGTKTGAVCWPA